MGTELLDGLVLRGLDRLTSECLLWFSDAETDLAELRFGELQGVLGLVDAGETSGSVATDSGMEPVQDDVAWLGLELLGDDVLDVFELSIVLTNVVNIDDILC